MQWRPDWCDQDSYFARRTKGGRTLLRTTELTVRLLHRLEASHGFGNLVIGGG
jgi:hypothetical protein